MRSLDRETALLDEAHASGEPPRVGAYLDMRLVNIGVLPTLGLIEYLHERELDAALLADPDMAELERLTSLLVVIINDL